MALPFRPGLVYSLLKEARREAEDVGPLVVTGARGLADVLLRELAAGAAPGAVVPGATGASAALAYVLAAEPTAEDEQRLKEADRAGVPTIAVLAGPELAPRVPYVLAVDVVRVPAGSGFPVERVAEALARRLGSSGPALAARVPALRAAVCRARIEHHSRRNALVGGLVFVPGADYPVIAANQVRLVLELASAHGVEVGQERLPEVLAVIGGGLGLRAGARRVVRRLPLPRFAVQGGIAYAGTRAVGEAALRYFEAAATRPPAAAARAEP